MPGESAQAAGNAAMPPVKVPWIVGRETLFEYAADEFLGEVTRQRPWYHARYESLLEELGVALDPNGQALLTDFTDERAGAWLLTLGAHRELAGTMLTEFRSYLREFGWLDV